MPSPSLKALTRFGDWWTYKISYLFVPFYVLLPSVGGGVGHALSMFGGLLGYFAATAALGHIINDLGDIDADAKAAKTNSCGGRSKTFVGMAATVAALGSAGFLWMAGAGPGAFALAIVEVLLFLGYSLPPLRLKESLWGVVVDSAYAHVLPFAVSASILFPSASVSGNHLAMLLAAAIVWQAFAGLRGIMGHEIEDMRVDAATGTRTTVVRIGVPRAEALVNRFIVPGEITFLLLSLLLLAGSLPLPATGFAIYSLVGFVKHRRDHRAAGSRKSGRQWWNAFLDPFYRSYLPLLTLGSVVIIAPSCWPFLVLHLLLFHLPRRTGLADRRGVPKSVIEHRFITSDGKLLIEIEGCYLTSQLTTRTDINIVLFPMVDGVDVRGDLSYGPNRFRGLYEKYHIEENPVCFVIRLKLPSAKKIKKGFFVLSLETRWTHPNEKVLLFSERIPLPTVMPET